MAVMWSMCLLFAKHMIPIHSIAAKKDYGSKHQGMRTRIHTQSTYQGHDSQTWERGWGNGCRDETHLG